MHIKWGRRDEVGVGEQSQLLLDISASNAGLITKTLYLGKAGDVGPAVSCQLLKSLAPDCLHDCYYYGAMLAGVDDVKRSGGIADLLSLLRSKILNLHFIETRFP